MRSLSVTVPTKLFLQPVEENRCPLVIDTRSQAEWDAGHANCAYRLEIHDDPSLESKLFQLALGDRSYPVQLYCRSGNRAGQAQSILQSYGWTNVTNARGWESGDQEDILKLCSFKDCVPPEPPKCPMLIDVRTKLEWDEGHAECAYRLEIHNDPSLEIVVFQLAQGNRKYPIEVHCASGKRAELARQILLKRGWKNVINAGGWTTGQRDTIEKVCDCTEDNNVCPKCGANPKTGKQSCCATGGAWFDKCGDPGNKNFEHTWSDGVNSCASKFMTCLNRTDAIHCDIRLMSMFPVFTFCNLQRNPRRGRETIRLIRERVPNVALLNLEKRVAALLVVLGSRNAEILAKVLSTLGPRELKPAKVRPYLFECNAYIRILTDWYVWCSSR